MKKEELKENIKDVGRDVGKGVGGFLKAKLIMLLITFVILVLGFLFSGVPIYLIIPLALIIAAIDLLPVVGCGIILIPWAVIAFFADNLQMTIAIAVTYVVLLVGRQIIEPKIMGDNIGVSPLITFLSTIVGSLLLGAPGLIVGPLVAVVINSIIRIAKRYRAKNNS